MNYLLYKMIAFFYGIVTIESMKKLLLFAAFLGCWLDLSQGVVPKVNKKGSSILERRPTQVDLSEMMKKLNTRLASLLRESSETACGSEKNFRKKVDSYNRNLVKVRSLLKKVLAHPDVVGGAHLQFSLIYNGLPNDWPEDASAGVEILRVQIGDAISDFVQKYQLSHHLPDDFLNNKDFTWKPWGKHLYEGMKCVLDDVA